MCSRPVQLERPLEEERPWTVDLEPGAYGVWADSSFEADDGLSGGTYAGFGLIVDDSLERAVIDVEQVELDRVGVLFQFKRPIAETRPLTFCCPSTNCIVW